MGNASSQRQIDQLRFKALYDLSKMHNSSRQEILDFALEAGVKVTNSKIGYIYLCSEDETELYLHAWSKDVMPQCRVETYPDKYLVAHTGLWGEAIRQRKPIITNDYASSQLRKGYPKGHVPIIRHMNLPVFDNKKIVLIAGVGNKENDYNQEDVQQLSLMMDGMWHILKRKQTEEALKKSNENLKNDLVKRKALEKQLRQAHKMESIGTLAGGIAHDFNNIISSVIGYTELTMGEVKKDSLAYENLTQVLSAGLRAKELVKQILTFSRQDETEPQPVLLRPMVKEVLKLIRVSLPEIIKIDQKIVGDPLIMADPVQIHQVLMNLCTNAGYAMEENDGVLTIDIQTIEIEKTDRVPIDDLKPGPYVRLKVSDTGCGMARHVQQRIFDPFFTTKKRGVGTGMGLSVVHGIVAGVGGSISVYSTPGNGTCFTVFFPAIERRLKNESRPREDLPAGSENIFIVDDEQPIVKMYSQILSSLGYQVSSTVSSLEAVKMFERRNDQIDLIISDTDMPDLTGLQLAEKIMEIRSDIPIIMCSGFISNKNAAIAEDLGIKAYLSKPVLMNELSRVVRNVLDSVQQE